MRTKPNHLDPVWLRKKYVDEGLSTYEIGRIVGRDSKTVYRKLIAFGIPTRPRGLNLAGDDNYMKRPGVTNPFQGRTHTEETKQILREKASVPKPNLRGAGNGMHKRTGAQNPNYKDGSAPERQKLYASGEWKQIIRQVYERDNYQCQRCGSGKKEPKGLHAHHIKPWAGNPSLRYDVSNLITLCRKCHEWVHSKANTAGEFCE